MLKPYAGTPASLIAHPANGKFEFVQDSPSLVEETRRAFVAPDTYELLPVPAPASNRSPIYNYGVKLKTEDKKGKTVYFFACFGNAKCRDRSTKGAYIGLGTSSTATSNALNHCKVAHSSRESTHMRMYRHVATLVSSFDPSVCHGLRAGILCYIL